MFDSLKARFHAEGTADVSTPAASAAFINGYLHA